MTSPPHDFFATTRWTVVVAAGDPGTPQAAEALETLCRVYWFPLYAYIRRRGHTREDAEDLTQAFFAGLLERRDFARADGAKGRFRAYLLGSLKNFLANEWDKRKCLKRGGCITHLTLDWQSADTQFQVADSASATPDRIFDREWAIALLAEVIARLQAECGEGERSRQFSEMKPFLTAGDASVPYAEVAARLGLEETAARVAVHRLRKRYRKLLRAEIAQTLADPAMVDEEMQALFAAFG